MTLRLDGKTAIITGGSKGLGAAYAKRLAQDGANIAIADRSGAEETVAAVQALGREALATTLDVTDEAAVGEFARTVEARFGRADILVNNAGIYPFQPFEEMAYADWRKVLPSISTPCSLCAGRWCRA
jgi:NAD(P)-dependent dehydrogenase (short-subunit alcohol dehydrogenase family)